MHRGWESQLILFKLLSFFFWFNYRNSYELNKEKSIVTVSLINQLHFLIKTV